MINPNPYSLEDNRLNWQLLDHRGLKRWSMSWTGSGGNPTAENHVISSYYQVIGGWCAAQFEINLGSSGYGSGEYGFSLPIMCASSTSWRGSALILDAGTAYYGGVIVVGWPASNTVAKIMVTNGVVGQLRFLESTVPFTFGSGDVITASIVYPV